jgi:uncharacterized protein (DUF4415 family)
MLQVSLRIGVAAISIYTHYKRLSNIFGSIDIRNLWKMKQVMESAMKTAKIEGTDEAWMSGELGRDAAHAKPAPKELEQAIDECAGLQPISIRLHKELIEKFKLIAKINGVGYQSLMRDALIRFATCSLTKGRCLAKIDTLTPPK